MWSGASPAAAAAPAPAAPRRPPTPAGRARAGRAATGTGPGARAALDRRSSSARPAGTPRPSPRARPDVCRQQEGQVQLWQAAAFRARAIQDREGERRRARELGKARGGQDEQRAQVVRGLCLPRVELGRQHAVEHLVEPREPERILGLAEAEPDRRVADERLERRRVASAEELVHRLSQRAAHRSLIGEDAAARDGRCGGAAIRERRDVAQLRAFSRRGQPRLAGGGNERLPRGRRRGDEREGEEEREAAQQHRVEEPPRPARRGSSLVRRRLRGRPAGRPVHPLLVGSRWRALHDSPRRTRRRYARRRSAAGRPPACPSRRAPAADYGAGTGREPAQRRRATRRRARHGSCLAQPRPSLNGSGPVRVSLRLFGPADRPRPASAW
jgi:hypothetical protein